MRNATFCGIPSGTQGGWGGRYVPSVLYGCVPVLLKDNTTHVLSEDIDWVCDPILTNLVVVIIMLRLVCI